MNTKYFFYILYALCVPFILAGAVNAGFSGYVMAVPFMVAAAWIGKYKMPGNGFFYGAIALTAFAVVVNHTQTHNPFLYPILSDGEIEVLQDGYLETYVADGSGLFISDEEREVGCVRCGPVKRTPLEKGDVLKVTGVHVSHLSFGTDFEIATDIGRFHEMDHDLVSGFETHIQTNKPVRAAWSERLSLLMAWPLLVLTPLSYF